MSFKHVHSKAERNLNVFPLKHSFLYATFLLSRSPVLLEIGLRSFKIINMVENTGSYQNSQKTPLANYKSRKGWRIHKVFTTYLMSGGIKLQVISNGKQIFLLPEGLRRKVRQDLIKPKENGELVENSFIYLCRSCRKKMSF